MLMKKTMPTPSGRIERELPDNRPLWSSITLRIMKDLMILCPAMEGGLTTIFNSYIIFKFNSLLGVIFRYETITCKYQ